MFAGSYGNKGTTKGTLIKQALGSSSLSTRPSSYYNVVICVDSSLPEAGSLFKSFGQLWGREQYQRVSS